MACVWRAQVRRKVHVTAWWMASGALATSSCKVARHLSTSATCGLCGKETDSSFRVLIGCNHAREFMLEQALGLGYMANLASSK